MENYIAERKLSYSDKGSSKRKELVIRVGIPYFDEKGMAKCPVEWDGLYEDYADICGMDSLQAIQLASDIEPHLKKLEKKYDFYWETGEPYFDDV